MGAGAGRPPGFDKERYAKRNTVERAINKLPGMLGVTMMLPAVVPCELGPVIPVGMTPATTFHCTGVGVAPLPVVVSHPVLVKKTDEFVPTVRAAGAWGVITQLPVGGAGVGGTGVTDGVQPASVTVAVGVTPSVCRTWVAFLLLDASGEDLLEAKRVAADIAGGLSPLFTAPGHNRFNGPSETHM